MSTVIYKLGEKEFSFQTALQTNSMPLIGVEQNLLEEIKNDKHMYHPDEKGTIHDVTLFDDGGEIAATPDFKDYGTLTIIKRMKTFCISLLVLLMSNISITALAYDIAVKNDDGITIYYNYSDSGEELTVTRESSLSPTSTYKGNVNIPESVKYMNRTRNVTAIDDNAFRNCTGLTAITIPPTIKNIGFDAFYGCKNLAVYISDLSAWCRISFSRRLSSSTSSWYTHGNPLRIASHFFLNGNEIKKLVIPNDITMIKDYAFSGCSSFTSLEIPNTVTSLGTEAFYSCDSIKSIAISNGVKTIGKRCFGGCDMLSTVSVGNKVDTIGFAAFELCCRLEKVIVNDMKNWCNIIFESYDANPLMQAHHLYKDENTEIQNLVIPSTVTEISSWLFYGCKSLISVVIPTTVKSIGNHAFQDCPITSISLGSGVKSIGYEAFSGCSLTSVTIPSSVTSIGEGAFNCSVMETVISKVANPFKISDDTFSSNTFYNATLYAPKGTKSKYKSTEGWKKFVWIEEGLPTRVETAKTDGEVIEKSHYTVDGSRLSSPRRGINIIKMSDGTIKKVYVK